MEACNAFTDWLIKGAALPQQVQKVPGLVWLGNDWRQGAHQSRFIVKVLINVLLEAQRWPLALIHICKLDFQCVSQLTAGGPQSSLHLPWCQQALMTAHLDYDTSSAALASSEVLWLITL